MKEIPVFYQCECNSNCKARNRNKEYIKEIERLHLRIERLKKEYNESAYILLKEEEKIMKKYDVILAEGNIHDLE